MKDFLSRLVSFCKDHFYVGLCHPARHAFIAVFGRHGIIVSAVTFTSVLTAKEALDQLHKEDL